MLFSAQSFFPAMQDRKIDVIGVGVSNTELIFRLMSAGADVTVRDKRTEDLIRPSTIARLRENGAKLQLGAHYLEQLDGEIIFRTPGMPFLTPELVRARQNQQIVTSELELFLELCPCKTIGVTGSDGKTTTTSLIAAMLRKTGKTVHLGGNIGKPLLSILDRINPNDICVIELSSFQLISMRCSPDIALVTNITPNHLDVHADMQEYVDAKKNIFLHQGAFSKSIVNADNAEALAMGTLARGRLFSFSRTESVPYGAWMGCDESIHHSTGGRAVKLMHRSEVMLPGLHNIENLLAAITAVWGIVSPRDIVSVAKTFVGVEHRIEFVRELNGVRWYNDSIATTPTRTIAGLGSFDQKMVLIMGGYDKGIPFKSMVQPLLEHGKAAVLTGDTAAKIEEAILSSPLYDPARFTLVHAADLAEAVQTAKTLAVHGEVVSLSPACASFDRYQNFEERGRHFKELVNALAE